MESLRKKLGFEYGSYIKPERLSEGLTLWWKSGSVVKVILGNKNMMETGIMVSRCSSMLRVFWVYMAPIFEDKKKV